MTALFGLTNAAHAQTPAAELTVFAAGSVRAAMTDLARALEREHPATVKLVFGPSGPLKDRRSVTAKTTLGMACFLPACD